MSRWENYITEEQCVIHRQCFYYYVLFPPIVSYSASQTNWGNQIWNSSWLQTLSV